MLIIQLCLLSMHYNKQRWTSFIHRSVSCLYTGQSVVHTQVSQLFIHRSVSCLYTGQSVVYTQVSQLFQVLFLLLISLNFLLKKRLITANEWNETGLGHYLIKTDLVLVLDSSFQKEISHSDYAVDETGVEESV